MAAKPVRSERNRASADRCLRTVGTTTAIPAAHEKRGEGRDARRMVASMCTQRQAGESYASSLLSLSGNCCAYPKRIKYRSGVLSAITRITGSGLGRCVDPALNLPAYSSDRYDGPPESPQTRHGFQSPA